MNSKIAIWVTVSALIAAAVATAAWNQSRTALRDAHQHIVAGELQPIATLLKDNQTLIAELEAGPSAGKDFGLLESYLANIRRDGVPKHAQMKQRLDQITENNAEIVALLKAYGPRAKTLAFVAEGDRFRNYTSAWRDRWNSVMELFMAGGNYPASGVPFPTRFPSAVATEIATSE